MIYLQTSIWSLAQRSRLMTLEHNSKGEENCNLRSAWQGTQGRKEDLLIPGSQQG